MHYTYESRVDKNLYVSLDNITRPAMNSAGTPFFGRKALFFNFVLRKLWAILLTVFHIATSSSTNPNFVFPEKMETKLPRWQVSPLAGVENEEHLGLSVV